MGACGTKDTSTSPRGVRGSNAPQKLKEEPTTNNEDTTIKRKSVRILTSNGASGIEIEEKQMQMARDHELYGLIKLLSIGDNQSRLVVANVLNSLSIQGNKMVVPQDEYLELVNLIEHKDEKIAVEAINTLRKLLHDCDDSNMKICHACADKIFQILKRLRTDVLCAVLSLLGNMATMEQIAQYIVDNKSYQVLIQLLENTNDFIVKREIFDLLQNLITSENASQVLDTKSVEQLIEIIKNDDEDSNIRHGALRILAVSAMGDNENIKRSIAECGAIPEMIRILSDRHDYDLISVRAASMALSGLSALPDLQPQIHNYFGIDMIMRLIDECCLDGGDEEMALALVMAVNNLCNNASLCEKFKSSHKLKTLLNRLSNETDNEDIQAECSEILEKITSAVDLHRSKFDR